MVIQSPPNRAPSGPCSPAFWAEPSNPVPQGCRHCPPPPMPTSTSGDRKAFIHHALGQYPRPGLEGATAHTAWLEAGREPLGGDPCQTGAWHSPGSCSLRNPLDLNVDRYSKCTLACSPDPVPPPSSAGPFWINCPLPHPPNSPGIKCRSQGARLHFGAPSQPSHLPLAPSILPSF